MADADDEVVADEDVDLPGLDRVLLVDVPERLEDEVQALLVTLELGTLVSFVVAYAAIAWLLRFVAHHSIAWFVPYRVALGLLLLALLGTGVMSAT